MKKNLAGVHKIFLSVYLIFTILSIFFLSHHFIIGIQIGSVSKNFKLIMSLSLELVASIFMLYIYYKATNDLKNKRDFRFYYLCMVIATQIGMLMDVFSHGVGFDHYYYGSLLRQIGFFCTRFAAFFVLMFFDIYILRFVEKNRSTIKKYAYYIGGFCSIALIVGLICIFTIQDKEKAFNFGGCYIVYLIFLGLTVVGTLVLILGLYIKYREKRVLQFLFYIFFESFVICIDVFWGTCFSYVGVAFALLMMYLSVQHDYECDLINKNFTLVKQSNEKLEKALLDAQQSNDAQQSFLIEMTHSIKNDSILINSYADICSNNIEDKVKLQDALDKIKQCSIKIAEKNDQILQNSLKNKK